jgi:SAM-dependent methyltransferase
LTFDRNLEVGVDPWWPPIQEAGTRGIYLLLTHADGGKMPYPDSFFGSAISNSVLEHIPEIESVLAETARVLKPGAPFVFCVPNHQFNDTLSIARFLDKLGLKSLAESYRLFFTRISRHVHLDDPETWTVRLAKAGFTVERHWHYFPPSALATLEWGHYFGLPSLITRKLFGRWILVKARWNLALTMKLIRAYAGTQPCEDGVYTFYITHRSG